MAKKRIEGPEPPREKSVRELLQELANANTLETARRGFAALDLLADKAKAAIKTKGIEGGDSAIDGLNVKLKRSIAEAMTGRKQQP